MNFDFLAFLLSIISAICGFDINLLRKILKKDDSDTSKDNKIIESINSVNERLLESKEIIDNALVEIEKQKKAFEELEKEAQLSKQVSNMNQEQVDALNKLLEKTLDSQEKKNLPKTFLFNLFFCLLGALLGYLLGKFL